MKDKIPTLFKAIPQGEFEQVTPLISKVYSINIKTEIELILLMNLRKS